MARCPFAVWTPIKVPYYGFPNGGEHGTNRPIAGVNHRTASESLASDEVKYLSNPGRKVSAHFLIDRDEDKDGFATTYQFIDTADAAWANGIINLSQYSPQWVKDLAARGGNPNECTISCEHKAVGADMPFTDAQIRSDKRLWAWVFTEHKMQADRDHLIGHYQIDFVNKAFCPSGPLLNLYPFDEVLAVIKGVNQMIEVIPGKFTAKVLCNGDVTSWVNIRDIPDPAGKDVGNVAYGRTVNCDAYTTQGGDWNGTTWLRLASGMGWITGAKGWVEFTPPPGVDELDATITKLQDKLADVTKQLTAASATVETDKTTITNLQASFAKLQADLSIAQKAAADAQASDKARADRLAQIYALSQQIYALAKEAA